MEAKRPSCPVDITPFVQQPSRLDNVHSVHIQWAADMRAWAVGIFVVKRVTSEILMSVCNVFLYAVSVELLIASNEVGIFFGSIHLPRHCYFRH